MNTSKKRFANAWDGYIGSVAHGVEVIADVETGNPITLYEVTVSK